MTCPAMMVPESGSSMPCPSVVVPLPATSSMDVVVPLKGMITSTYLYHYHTYRFRIEFREGRYSSIPCHLGHSPFFGFSCLLATRSPLASCLCFDRLISIHQLSTLFSCGHLICSCGTVSPHDLPPSIDRFLHNTRTTQHKSHSPQCTTGKANLPTTLQPITATQ